VLSMWDKNDTSRERSQPKFEIDFSPDLCGLGNQLDSLGDVWVIVGCCRNPKAFVFERILTGLHGGGLRAHPKQPE